MSEETSDSVTGFSEATFAKLTESLQQYSASALTNLTVPEFKGSPGEDVKDFLGRFKLATITLSDQMRCLAIQKALTGSAKIWSKENLKLMISTGDWKGIKKALIERFEGPNASIRNLERLSKMKFDRDRDTLLSYVERYASTYRLAHEKATDSDVIRSIQTNLPDKVQRSLNILNDEWTNFKSIRDLYSLVRRAEDKILAYETKDEPESTMKPAEVVKMMQEMQAMLKKNLEKKDEVTAPNQQVALAAREAAPFPREPTGQAPQRDQRYHPYQRQPDPYKRNYGQRQGPNQSFVNRGRPLDNPRAIERREPPRAIAYPNQGRAEPKRDNDLIDKYQREYGKPPGPCQICKGAHYNRHCPYRGLN